MSALVPHLMKLSRIMLNAEGKEGLGAISLICSNILYAMRISDTTVEQAVSKARKQRVLNLERIALTLYQATEARRCLVVDTTQSILICNRPQLSASGMFRASNPHPLRIQFRARQGEIMCEFHVRLIGLEELESEFAEYRCICEIQLRPGKTRDSLARFQQSNKEKGRNT